MHADLRSWLGLGAGLAVALIAVAISNIGQLVYLMDVHPGVAGWVQAVGSIAAIFASVLGAWWLQDRQRRLDAYASAVAELEALLIVAISGHRAVQMFQNRTRAQDWTGFNLDVAIAALSGEIEALRAISLAKLPNRRARSKLNDLRVILVAVLSMAVDLKQQVAKGRLPPLDMFDSFVTLVAEARDTIGTMCAEEG